MNLIYLDFGSVESQWGTVLLRAESWTEPVCVNPACAHSCTQRTISAPQSFPFELANNWVQGEITQKLDNLYLGPIRVPGESSDAGQGA